MNDLTTTEKLALNGSIPLLEGRSFGDLFQDLIDYVGLNNGSVGTAALADGAVTSAKMSLAAKSRTVVIPIEDLAAGADIAARAALVAPGGGATLTGVGIVLQGSAAGVDGSNTAVVAIADSSGNSIVTKTYNNVTAPPSANTYDSLGTLDATYKVLTAHEVVTVAVTQGATANLPNLLLVLEYVTA